MAQTPAKQAPPQTMLWSWYAEDDFRPLAKPGLGIAYLALSLEFEGQVKITPSPRTAAVRIPPSMYKMAVIRFDPSPFESRRPAFSPGQRELAVRMIAEITEFARPQAVQIDFDAPRSAWPFYRQLLADVRARIGSHIFLSITALVSWCDAPQSWLDGLPVDEIVPMAFFMGQATPATITMLARGGQFPFPGCRGSIGVELRDPLGYVRPDPLVRPNGRQRAYFFPNAQPWSPALVSKAKESFLR